MTIEDKHYIKNSFMRNGDVDVECKCGWVMGFIGNVSISQIEEEFKKHIEDERENEAIKSESED